MEDNIDDIYSLRKYPKHLRKIVKVLIKHENSISDGFEWYASVESITKLAQELFNTMAL